MDQQTMKQHGAFSWNELKTTDVTAAKAFYGELFGWEMHDEQTPEMIYTIAKTGDNEVGGIMAIPSEAEDSMPIWGPYITVDNVDEQIKQAEALGGKTLVAPRDIPDLGRFAVISDPQGAMLTIITYTCQE